MHIKEKLNQVNSQAYGEQQLFLWYYPSF